MAAYTRNGEELPRSLLHHLIAVNFSRRQLVYPVAERLFGVGTETPDVKLPDFLQVPLSRGDSIGFYTAWNNVGPETLEDVYVHVVLPYAPSGRSRESVFPFYVDTSNKIGGSTSFDLPSGRSEKSFEFELPLSGGLLAASGHLHDYGVELRIEEVESGRVITRLRPVRDEDGHVMAVEQKIFRRLFNLVDARVRFDAGVRYRVVGVYENPTGGLIVDGGMAHVVGLFAPDDPTAWPAVDPLTEAFRTDAGALPDPLGVAHLHEHE
ncbi:MAG: hypothetical protein AB7T31_17925 [Gemmatimonadales bacterium]